ncbi:MAG: DUF4258 domain-containing protein [Chloroflexi bacterium]|nr:DUF4258 domain-containing protein [Chloroflexota bacterium]MYE32768.1 DUF4258 domain-containing protein [Chloroflexota bacterium]
MVEGGELRYSRHASERMEAQGITREMVEGALSAPDVVVEGDTAHEYDTAVGGRTMRIVVATRRNPRIVVTVYWLEG